MTRHIGVLRRLPRRDDDEGVYAILFALLVVVLVGVVAFALDLALVRESRAAGRSLTDSAVVAGAGSLRDATGRWTPNAACKSAWAYISPKVPNSSSGPASCNTPFTDPVTTCPATGSAATWVGGDYRVVITWPVPRFLADGTTPNPLLNQPDTLPARPTQGFDPDQDGTDAGCDRLAVQVFQNNKLGLSGIFGVSSVTASATSVARSVVTGETGERIAALNILETTSCDALTTTGGGTINVGTVARPGNISVDSNGSTNCGGQKRVISPENASNNGIFVIGTGGTLTSYALAGANSAKSYDAGLVPARLNPAPTLQTAPVTRSPVDRFYNCPTGASPCAPGGGDYVRLNLKNPYDGLTAAAAATAGYTVVPNSACNVNNPTVITGAKVYFDCNSSLDVKAPLFLSQATVVVSRNAIAVTSGGCLVMNAPSYATATTATACPTDLAQIDAGTVASDGILALQDGSFTQAGTSQVALRNTVTYLKNGYTDFSGSGLLYLTNPEGLGCSATDLACKYAKFWKLTLWSEFTTTNKPFKYRGQSALKLRGVLFTPNGASDLAGGSGTQQNRAQFWTRTLNVAGGAAVTMDVDPDASIPQPAYGGALIR